MEDERFVRKLHPNPSPEARVVIETAPGEECQVDYGAAPWCATPLRARIGAPGLFVMTLGYS
jgi:hypothetical protein